MNYYRLLPELATADINHQKIFLNISIITNTKCSIKNWKVSAIITVGRDTRSYQETLQYEAKLEGLGTVHKQRPLN